MRHPILFLLLSLPGLVRAQEIPPPLAPADIAPPLKADDLKGTELGPLARAAAPDAPPAAPVIVAAAVGFGDADSRAAARAPPRDCRTGPWIASYRKARGMSPRLKVLGVRNRSTAFVNTSLLVSELATGLGALAVKERPNVVLLGWLLAQSDAARGSELQSFLLSLSAVDLESGEKLWTGLHRVRKLIARTTVGGREEVKVTRLKPGQLVDLSGAFNDADADRLATALLRDLTASPWLKRHTPVLRFYPLRNRTSEMVNGLFLTAIIEHGLMRTGKARVLCGREDQGALRAERAAQLAGSPRPPRAGAELPATHVVSGTLTAQSSATGKEELRQYQLAMEAFSVENNSKDWVRTARVRKIIAIQANP